jgi:hypothetical protein
MRCLTFRIRLPNVYPTISESRRRRLVSLRLRLDSSRRRTEARVGLVLWRGLGGSAACWMRRTSRARAACRFRSCDRNCLASMINIPSEVIRLPASLVNRCCTSVGMDGDPRALNRSWTEDDTLFTFWPPGPGERINTNSISCSSSLIDGVISIMQQVYQHGL